MAQGRRDIEMIGNGKPFWQQRHVATGKQPEGATAADGKRKVKEQSPVHVSCE